MELIKIDNNRMVSARELYEKLGSNERFSKWFERMSSYGFMEKVDYTPYQNVHPQNKQEILDYNLTIDTAKQICMLQRSEIGTKFRLYFIECEKKLSKPMSPLDMIIEMANIQKNMESRVDNIEKIVDNTLTIDHGKQLVLQKKIATRVYNRIEALLKCDETKVISPPKMFKNIHRELKNKFGVPSYKDILIKDFDLALIFIENWFEDKELRG